MRTLSDAVTFSVCVAEFSAQHVLCGRSIASYLSVCLILSEAENNPQRVSFPWQSWGFHAFLIGLPDGTLRHICCTSWSFFWCARHQKAVVAKMQKSGTGDRKEKSGSCPDFSNIFIDSENVKRQTQNKRCVDKFVMASPAVHLHPTKCQSDDLYLSNFSDMSSSPASPMWS